MSFNKFSIIVFAFWVVLFSLVGITIAYTGGSAPSVSHTAYQIEQGPGSGLNAEKLGGLDVNQIIAASSAGAAIKDWNSGWIYDANNGIVNISHNLGGNPEDYLIDLKCRNAIGINQPVIGGDGVQLWWSQLTSTSIKVTKASDNICNNGVSPNVYIHIVRLR